MRIYMLPPEGNLYKTNLHCHSTVTDGKFSPAQIKELYMEKGYSAVCYTDHQICQPHTELTDENFVALTGVEIAIGLKKATNFHVCGIARNPNAELFIANEPMDDVNLTNEGIARLKQENFITTLNHPRWSGLSPAQIAAVEGIDNMEVLNGYELMQDGYGDSSACYETELRAGRKARPLATDDTHTMSAPGECGYEYFRGFTVLKAPELTYDALISALDEGAYYASTGPMIHNLWLEDNILHVECSPVCGVYAHGHNYNHRAAKVTGEDTLQVIDLDVSKVCIDSNYLFVQIVNTKGERAWASPLWFK